MFEHRGLKAYRVEAEVQAPGGEVAFMYEAEHRYCWRGCTGFDIWVSAKDDCAQPHCARKMWSLTQSTSALLHAIAKYKTFPCGVVMSGPSAA
jgi:hypothetical protein